jgi:uncharacterized membrane protein
VRRDPPAPRRSVPLSRSLQASREIAAPLRLVYQRAAAFQDYPAFLPGLVAVRQISARRLQFEARIGDSVHRWPARITELRRDRSVAIAVDQRFRATARARLRHAGPDATAVQVEVEYALDPLRERLLALLFDPQAQLEAGIDRFRDWVEDEYRDAPRRRPARRAAAG